jgi:hypothetical protein
MNITGTLPFLEAKSVTRVSGGQIMHVYVMIDALSAWVKRLGLAFKFGFKFPVGGSVPVQ